MSSPKVVVIGAGSMFFGRQALWAMIDSSALSRGTLAYVDTDTERLDKMMNLARKAIKHRNSPLALEGSTDRREVLADADFVVLTFTNRGVHYRGVDCEIGLRHGIRMCSGDTIGPGGVFRAMRELPVILEAARDVEELCPSAWVINYINPTAVGGIGLMRHANVKSFALCDGLHMPHVRHDYMKQAGIEVTPQNEAKFDLRIAGVNHFTWMLSATLDGRDVSDDIRASMEKEAAEERDDGHAKKRFNKSYSLKLWDAFGLLPACIAHTKEYVRFWQGHGAAADDLPPLSIFPTDERYQRHAEMWESVDAYNAGSLPMDHFFENMRADHATDIIEAMWTGSDMPFYVNTANRGAVPNLPDDAFLELQCDLDMERGPCPRPVGPFPLGLRALQMQVLDTHELTAQGIAEFDKDLLVRALCTDPLTQSIADAREMLEEALVEERDALPAEWYQEAEKKGMVPGNFTLFRSPSRLSSPEQQAHY